MASDKGKHVLLVTLVLVLGIKENNAAVTQHPSTDRQLLTQNATSSPNLQPNSTTIPTPSALSDPYCDYKLQEIEMCDGLQAYLEGPKGDIGPVGLKGSMGSRGEKGDLGEGGSIGLRGGTGLTGLKGNEGEQGVGLQGHKGLKGYKGQKGFQGQTGYKGQKGATGRGSFAAFTVHRTSGLTASKSNRIITYDIQTIDYGNNILTHEGIFVCDIAGIYYFSYAFETNGDAKSNVNLFKNGVSQNGMHAENQAGRGDIVVSQSIVLSLRVGDRVWLELYKGTSFDATTNENKLNTFSGFLIHEY